MTLTIEIKINDRVIAYAAANNVSSLADISDYHVVWNEDEAAEIGIENDYGKFVIKAHNRRQSVWALAAKIVSRIVGSPPTAQLPTPDQGTVWEQAHQDFK